MKKLLSAFFITLLCGTVFAQGVTRAFVLAGNSRQGVAYSVGQTFNQHAPSEVSVPLVAEGLQQGYAVVAHDTLLLLSDEMEDYRPGDTLLLGLTPEGYDEQRHRQVYELVCNSDCEHTMSVSGAATYAVTLPEPQILPAGSAAPDGPVTLLFDRTNPYDYPVGATTDVLWTASVAGQTKLCPQKVVIRAFDCAAAHPAVTDFDGHSYPVVSLGHYCWTARNLRTLHYADGSSVPSVLTFPASYAPGVADMAEAFGHLYTWEDATQYNVAATRMQGVCPDGWHVPTGEEVEYLLSMFESTELMSDDPQLHWLPADGTDDYGFSFLPAGAYSAVGDKYEGLYVYGCFWTTETEGSTIAHACRLGDACGSFEIVPGEKLNGYSVRCVLDY